MPHPRRTAIAATTAAALLIGLAPPAPARTVDVSERIVKLRNQATFQMTQLGPQQWGLPDGAVVVLDAAIGDRTDAFDGALGLHVHNDETDDDTSVPSPDGTARVDRDTLAFDPRDTDDLLVSGTYQAIPGTTAIRVLARVFNPTGEPLDRVVRINSNLSSDANTTVEDSSDGDAVFDRSDRWFITSDDGVNDDLVVTQAWFGIGDTRSANRCLFATGTQTDVSTLGAQIVLQPGQTRYLLYFASVDTSVRAARRAASVFDKRKLSPLLLKGLSQKVRRNILNWDL